MSDLTLEAPATDRTVILRNAGEVIRTLLYFDIFQHPLRREEVERFSPHPPEATAAALDLLLEQGVVRRIDGHYQLSPIDGLVGRRLENEERAQRRMVKARHNARFIGAFPFVRGVLLSGSISKGVLAADGDIDYFVITTPGRLWVARTLLILYKKLILLNSRRDFCVNYFVDTDHLAIEDRNLFTATEIVTLNPMHGTAACEAFFAANHWAFDRFPNAGKPPAPAPDLMPGRSQRIFEKVLASRMGEHLDDLCMRLTFLRWKKKFGHMDARSFELALRTRKYVSKHHPQSFQQRVLTALDERMRGFELRHGLTFT